MSDKSPLFVSALELLAHATELYASGRPRNYKFVILHLANAVELIAKDCLIDHGVSIYKNPNETITIWGGFSELAKLGIVIPQKPVIELLIDDRNTIQHRFGFPNAEAVFYYLEEVVAFFTRFLNEQYKVDLAEALEKHLSADNLALLGLVKDNFSHFKKLMQISPEAAIQQVFASVEKEIDQILFAGDLQARRRIPPFSSGMGVKFLRELANKGYLSEDIAVKFKSLQNVRNQAAHGAPIDDSNVNWESELDTAIQILSAIDKAKRNGVIKTSNEDGPFESLWRLSSPLAVEVAIYVAESELDRVRSMPRFKSLSSLDRSRGTYVGILNLLAANNYLPQDIEEKYHQLGETKRAQESFNLDQDVDWQSTLTTAGQIVTGISKAQLDGFFRRHAASVDKALINEDQQSASETKTSVSQDD
ncbi:MAG: hypothetical protein HY870_09670 [Chloroflexi bacterium]|nr:hypothetical protein [Chloroflexota bacterium]